MFLVWIILFGCCGRVLAEDAPAPATNLPAGLYAEITTPPGFLNEPGSCVQGHHHVGSLELFPVNTMLPSVAFAATQSRPD